MDSIRRGTNKGKINGNQVLFQLRVDDNALGMSQDVGKNVIKPFGVVFYKDDTEIAVADVKKAPQTKPSKPKR